MRSTRRAKAALVAILMAASAALAISPASATATSAAEASAQAQPEPERPSVVRIVVPDHAAFQRLVAAGTDIAGRVRPGPSGIEADVVVTPSQLAALSGLGAQLAPTGRPQPKPAPPQAPPRTGQDADQITVERAVWFKSQDGYFISVEATSSAGADATLTAAWTGSHGTSGQTTLIAYQDAGAYLGHQPQAPAPAQDRPRRVTVTSDLGGTATARVTEWPAGEEPATGRRYRKDFVDHYMPPQELYDRITRLHRRFPELTDLIRLPFKTNGYRRHAQAVVGAPPDAAVVVTSKTYGSEGGNDIMIELIAPDRPDRPLTVTADGKHITVGLATDAAGTPVSTAAQVAAALNTTALVSASTYRGDAGGSAMSPVPAVQLDDHLNAPPSVSRDPMRVLALRVGVHRDGSRTGVLAYAQEHAREWVTPLVTIETAERLLRNYATDPATRRLLRETDIFIMPSVNPDGANYSFYDFNLQRKNMRNYCPAAQADPGLRTTWGVDLNRNYAAGSLFDGYFGASSNCQSGTFAGPAEHSEPESRNVIWMAQRFRNIRFAMNVHSYGGYFMWPPGAYRLDGRVTLPRPTSEQEAYFLASARTIEEAIAAERGTVTWPQQTGPVTDVLYSAAGNSADELWYDYGVFGWDFEVGNDRWNPATQEWEGVGFQPPFSEGHEEALEYASGLIALLGVAADFPRTITSPNSALSSPAWRTRRVHELTYLGIGRCANHRRGRGRAADGRRRRGVRSHASTLP